MTNGQMKQHRIAQGWVLKEGISLLENKAFYSVGCLWDGPLGAWLAPDAETFAALMRQIDSLWAKKREQLAGGQAVSIEATETPSAAVAPAVAPAVPRLPDPVISAQVDTPKLRLVPAPVAAPSPSDVIDQLFSAVLGPAPALAPKPETVVPPPPPPASPPVSGPTPAKAAPQAAEVVKLLQLPPSMLVVNEVSLRGKVQYDRLSGDEKITEAGGRRNSEEVKTTRRLVENVDEYEQAQALASQLRATLRKFGRVLHSGVVLVPCESGAELDAAIVEVRQLAAEHNAKALDHFVYPSVIKEAITSDAEATARDVALSIRDVMGELKEALEACDVDRIRTVSGRLKTFTAITTGPDADALTAAVQAARKAASYIKTEAEKKGRQIDTVRQELALSAVEATRLRFLDYAVPEEMKAAVASDRFGGLDFSEPAPVAASNGVASSRFANLE